mgnify:CR=1 FL=1
MIERDMTCICIIAIKDKKMGFIHIDWVYFVYIMHYKKRHIHDILGQTNFFLSYI